MHSNVEFSGDGVAVRCVAALMEDEGNRMGESWLSPYDRQLAELRERHPGWRVWYVPFATRKGVCWCAQPEPVINADTAEQLSEEIASTKWAPGNAESGGLPTPGA
jgi:hypothetical protein